MRTENRCQDGRVAFLSSGGGWTPNGERALYLDNPELSITLQNGAVVLKCATHRTLSHDDPLAILEETLGQGYLGVGYFGYEFFKFLQPGFIPNPRKDGQVFPDASFLFFDKSRLREKKIERSSSVAEVVKTPNHCPTSNMPRSEFTQMVERARQYIANGDIYQVNLSQRFETPFSISPELFLFKLYRAQPVPFACYLDFGDFQLLSGSMELFLRKHGRRLASRPIKGTRRRGKDEREDEALRVELRESEKERAENLMIVDLMRNDLGRVCESGSVRVNHLFKIESYSTLHQMVSEVEGKIRDGVTVKEIIQNTSPPGSVTGVPKRRAMEIIDELEPHLRGPYCGAIGLFEPNGDFTLSVAIRILAASHGKGLFWVGGGIMWNSVPEQEYEETLIKAKAIMKALA